MKKTGKALISILVIALLLCAVTTTALAASAPSVSASADSADPGQEVQFTVMPNNEAIQSNVTVQGPLTFVSATGGNELMGFPPGENEFLVMGASAALTYTYRVNADATTGESYSFTLTNVKVTNLDLDEDEVPVSNVSVSGTVAGEVPAAPAEPAPVEPAPVVSEEPAPAAPAAAAETPQYAAKTLPAGTMYYTMVNGAPGASHTLNKATTVAVIEKMPNGYTKIMMGTTTYLVKSTVISSGSSSTTADPSKLDSVPKTADATGTTWALALMTIAAAAGAGLFALKKVTAK